LRRDAWRQHRAADDQVHISLLFVSAFAS